MGHRRRAKGSPCGQSRAAAEMARRRAAGRLLRACLSRHHRQSGGQLCRPEESHEARPHGRRGNGNDHTFYVATLQAESRQLRGHRQLRTHVQRRHQPINVAGKPPCSRENARAYPVSNSVQPCAGCSSKAAMEWHRTSRNFPPRIRKLSSATV